MPQAVVFVCHEWHKLHQFFFAAAGLSQKPNQQVYANVSPMRLEQNQLAISSEHKLVSAACIGTFNPQPFQTLNQFAT
jgi:hypothetical protein